MAVTCNSPLIVASAFCASSDISLSSMRVGSAGWECGFGRRVKVRIMIESVIVWTPMLGYITECRLRPYSHAYNSV